MDAAVAVGSARQVMLEEAYRLLLTSLPAVSAGTRDTPVRAAKAWGELTCGYYTDPYDLLTSFDAEGHDELVCVSGIPFYSLCEHHLLPFHGTADVGYIPAGRIVGLSKIARIVDAYARRLQVQERLTDQIAECLASGLDARGVIVIIRAEHLCMTMRGVMKPGSLTTTSVVRGLLKENTAARQEALALFAAQP